MMVRKDPNRPMFRMTAKEDFLDKTPCCQKSGMALAWPTLMPVVEEEVAGHNGRTMAIQQDLKRWV